MAHSLGEALFNAWLCALCFNALRPREREVVYVRATVDSAAGVASDELPLIACATMQRDSAPHEKV